MDDWYSVISYPDRLPRSCWIDGQEAVGYVGVAYVVESNGRPAFRLMWDLRDAFRRERCS